jgi:hypothetical protein
MLTPAQRNSLDLAKAAVMNACSPYARRRASDDFRFAVATVADEIGCDSCAVELADVPPKDLNEQHCTGLIDLLEANSPDPGS